MMRDARINTIGEGANEVLKAFIALVGDARHRRGVQGDARGAEVAVAVRADPLAVRRASGSAGWRRPADGARALARRCGRSPTCWPARRPVRLGGRAGAGPASRGRPRPPVRPGADRRRRDRPDRPPSCTLARLDRELVDQHRHRAPTAPPASSTSAWPTAGSTRRSRTSTTTTTRPPPPPPMPRYGA